MFHLIKVQKVEFVSSDTVSQTPKWSKITTKWYQMTKKLYQITSKLFNMTNWLEGNFQIFTFHVCRTAGMWEHFLSATLDQIRWGKMWSVEIRWDEIKSNYIKFQFDQIQESYRSWPGLFGRDLGSFGNHLGSFYSQASWFR